MRKLSIIILLLVSLSGFSTNLYWKNLTGNSNVLSNWATDTVTWTTALALPTSVDNVFFTKAAGNVTCTLTATISCFNWDCHGFTGTVVSNGTLYPVSIYGNGYLMGTMPIVTASFYCRNTSAATWQSNGVHIGNFYKYEGNGEMKLLDAMYCVGMNMTAGLLNYNGQSVTENTFAITSSTSPSSLTTGNANITITANACLDVATNGSNFTLNATGSTIHITSGNPTFKGNGLTFGNLYIEGINGTATITGSNHFAELKVNVTSGKTVKFTDGTTQTVTTLTADGTPGNRITLTGTSTAGWAIIKSSGITRVSFCNISYSTATGGDWMAGSNSTSLGFNSGWKFNNSLLFGTNF
ncbi:MAG: hypothetical protein WCO44_13350 [Bacteroidota bacterium]